MGNCGYDIMTLWFGRSNFYQFPIVLRTRKSKSRLQSCFCFGPSTGLKGKKFKETEHGMNQILSSLEIMRIRVILFMVVKGMKHFYKRIRDQLFCLQQNITIQGPELIAKQESFPQLQEKLFVCSCVKLSEWVIKYYVAFLFPGLLQSRANNPTLYRHYTKLYCPTLYHTRHFLKFLTTFQLYYSYEGF